MFPGGESCLCDPALQAGVLANMAGGAARRRDLPSPATVVCVAGQQFPNHARNHAEGPRNGTV